MKRAFIAAVAVIWLVFSIACGGADDPDLYPYTAPSITEQPQDRTVPEASTATFSVKATGNPSPTFQWYQGDGTPISGADHAAYTTEPVATGDDGDTFYVIAKNSAGSAMSRKAALHIQMPDPPQITSLTPLTAQVSLYGRFELSAGVISEFQNPFDYGEVRLHGIFTSPSGKTKEVDGFYFQDYSQNTTSGALTRTGNPQWRLRFTPDETGAWTYVLSFTNPAGTATYPEQTFQVAPGPEKGFIHAANDRYLKFEDDSPFFPIGENMGWYDASILDYETWMDRLAANGGNFIRVWMASWSFAIEWNDTGLGNYSGRQDRAWNLDWLLERAKSKGIQIQLCLNNHGQVSSQINPEWDDNPYNAGLGGPCANTWDFFTDLTARNWYKNRTRYIVARWGYATNLAAWEIFNEVEWTDDFDQHHDAVTVWHDEMAQYLHTIDPYRHLVTTSYAIESNDPATWSLHGLDYTQTHYYSSTSDVESLHRAGILRYQTDFGKPTLVGEFGLNVNDTDLAQLDPGGIHLHNAIWSHTASGALGAGMLWWWDSYVNPQDLYHHYMPLSLFVSGLDLLGSAHVPADLVCTSDTTADLVLTPGFMDWGRSPQSSFAIGPDGGLSPGISDLGSYVFGQYNNQYRNPPTFQTQAAVPMSFIVNIAAVADSGGTVLIRLDGTTVLDAPAVTGNAYTVTVPAGTHAITVDNDGLDWFQVADYTISGAYPALRSYAMASDAQIFGWAQNRSYNWRSVRDHGIPLAITNGQIRINGLPDRSWILDWYDCATGSLLDSSALTSSGGVLSFLVPSLVWDLAYRIH